MDLEGKHIKAFQSGTPYGFYSGRQGSVLDNYLMSFQNTDMTGTYSSEGSDISSVVKPVTISNMATGQSKTTTTTEGTNAISQDSGGNSIWQNPSDNNNKSGFGGFVKNNGNTIGQGMTIGGSVLSNELSKGNENPQYNSAEGFGGDTAAGASGVVGIFGKAMKIVPKLKSEEYDENGNLTSNSLGMSGEKARYAGGIVDAANDPTSGIKDYSENKDMYDRYGYSKGQAYTAIGLNFLAPGAAEALGSGKKRNTVKEQVAKDRTVYNKEIDKKNEIHDKDMADLKKSQDTYNRTMLSAGSIRVAKRGGLLSYGYDITYTLESNHIDKYTRSPFKFEYTNKEDSKNHTIKSFRRGSSIIPTGAYHHTSNNLGDLGLPVVDDNGVKIFEIETKELITSPEASIAMNNLVKEYNKTKDKAILKEISMVAKEELIKNTYSYNDEYACLNEGNCKLKN